ncbi:hypothetical protein D3C84_1143740 [compost metagenome]
MHFKIIAHPDELQKLRLLRCYICIFSKLAGDSVIYGSLMELPIKHFINTTIPNTHPKSISVWPQHSGDHRRAAVPMKMVIN